MKNLKIVIIICLALITSNTYSQITVSSSGWVGINNSTFSYPYYRLRVNGDFKFDITGTSRIITSYGNRILFHDDDVYSDNDADIGTNYARWDSLHASRAYFNYYPVIGSDIKLKKDIQELDNKLDKLIDLKPVKYKMLSKQEFYEATGNNFSGLSAESVSQFGLIAQEVQEIFPQIVSNLDNTYLGIKYTELIPVLIKGLQEQQEKIDQLKAQAETMENEYSAQNENLKSGLIEGADAGERLNNVKLYPADINPVGKRINIRYEIPESVKNAQLYICDITGRLLKTKKVNANSTGSITIEANDLVAGKYLYTLVCDGSFMDTKQMLLKE